MTPEFRRSRFCVSGECVAVAFIPGRVLVRHFRGSNVTLEFTDAEWAVFVAGVRAGEFDVPTPTGAAA